MIFHSDGVYTPILPDLLDIGVNGINPLQPDHMDAAKIRAGVWSEAGVPGARWAAETAFHTASPEAIRQEVRLRIDSLGRAGLILAPAYDLGEPDIPWANVAAFLEAVHGYGGRD